MTERRTLVDLLPARGPDPTLADRLASFGRLVGSWDLDMTLYERDGKTRAFRGEWHFGWVLEGRGIQDVLIAWPVARTDEAGTKRGGTGTTLRVFAEDRDLWVVLFVDPFDGEFNLLIAREADGRIVQEGAWTLADPGRRFQWTFLDITEDSFRWESRVFDDGDTWRLTQEISARRVR